MNINIRSPCECFRIRFIYFGVYGSMSSPTLSQLSANDTGANSFNFSTIVRSCFDDDDIFRKLCANVKPPASRQHLIMVRMCVNNIRFDLRLCSNEKFELSTRFRNVWISCVAVAYFQNKNAMHATAKREIFNDKIKHEKISFVSL